VITRDQDGKQDIGLVELGNMDVKIKYEKLFSTFENMMEGYSHLDSVVKSYDYWVQEKGGYVDSNVLNFYVDIDEDYEDDDWIMQYQDEPGDYVKEEDLPVLTYGKGYSFPAEESMFGKYFEELFKDWFEKVYGHKVKTVVSI
jgi:hypothetical protein